jgi:hypothetical protein
VQETVCKRNSRVLLLGQCDESFQVSDIEGVPSEQKLMRDFHDKS